MTGLLKKLKKKEKPRLGAVSTRFPVLAPVDSSSYDRNDSPPITLWKTPHNYVGLTRRIWKERNASFPSVDSQMNSEVGPFEMNSHRHSVTLNNAIRSFEDSSHNNRFCFSLVRLFTEKEISI